MPITSKFLKFKGATQHYVVKLPKSSDARHNCLKDLRVTGTLGIRANSSPNSFVTLYAILLHCSINSIALGSLEFMDILSHPKELPSISDKKSWKL